MIKFTPTSGRPTLESSNSCQQVPPDMIWLTLSFRKPPNIQGNHLLPISFDPFSSVRTEIVMSSLASFSSDGKGVAFPFNIFKTGGRTSAQYGFRLDQLWMWIKCNHPCLYECVPIYLSIYLSRSVRIYLSQFNYMYPSVFLSIYLSIYVSIVAAISYGREQQQISKWYLLEKICMYVYEIFTKYTWNIYVFITY